MSNLDQMLPVKVIRLSQGQIAIIDPDDYELVSSYKWTATRHEFYSWYAVTPVLIPGKTRPMIKNGAVYNRSVYKQIRLHTLITGYSRTDHANGNGLDNRKGNLREATAQQNVWNTKKPRNSHASIYKGVRPGSKSRRWQAYIRLDGRFKSLGYFINEIDAAKAYDNTARKYFGIYACVNYPMPGERSALEGMVY